MLDISKNQSKYFDFYLRQLEENDIHSINEIVYNLVRFIFDSCLIHAGKGRIVCHNYEIIRKY